MNQAHEKHAQPADEPYRFVDMRPSVVDMRRHTEAPGETAGLAAYWEAERGGYTIQGRVRAAIKAAIVIAGSPARKVDHDMPGANILGTMRCTGTERDQCLDRLADAYAQGAINDSELAARIALAQAANTTAGLGVLVGDLPSSVRDRPPSGPRPQPVPAPKTRQVSGKLVTVFAGAAAWLAGCVTLLVLAVQDNGFANNAPAGASAEAGIGVVLTIATAFTGAIWWIDSRT